MAILFRGIHLNRNFINTVRSTQLNEKKNQFHHGLFLRMWSFQKTRIYGHWPFQHLFLFSMKFIFNSFNWSFLHFNTCYEYYSSIHLSTVRYESFDFWAIDKMIGAFADSFDSHAVKCISSSNRMCMRSWETRSASPKQTIHIKRIELVGWLFSRFHTNIKPNSVDIICELLLKKVANRDHRWILFGLFWIHFYFLILCTSHSHHRIREGWPFRLNCQKSM